MSKSALRTLPLLLLCAGASTGRAGFGGTGRGTSSAGFLKLGAGARAAAMGEAHAAAADDPSALYWNPAALARVPGRRAAFTHAALPGSTALEYGAYSHGLGEAGTLGLSAQRFSAGDIAETDETGTETGSFSPADLAVSIGYGRRLDGPPGPFQGLSLGLGLKFVESRVLRAARTFAADLGVLSPPWLDRRLGFALAVSNLGGKLRFESEEERLPLALRLGSAYRASDLWLLALDLALPEDAGPYAALGAERSWPLGGGAALAGRAGFNSRAVGDADGLAGASLGLGLALRRWRLDYGFSPFGGLGAAHRVSVSMNF